MDFPKELKYTKTENGSKKVVSVTRDDENIYLKDKTYWDVFLKGKKFTQEEIFEIYNEMNDDEVYYLLKHCQLPALLLHQLARKKDCLYFIYTTQSLTSAFIDRYEEKIDIPLMIFKNPNLDYKEVRGYLNDFDWNYYEIDKMPKWFLEKYKNHIDWDYFSFNVKKSRLTKKFVQDFKNELNFHILSRLRTIDISNKEAFNKKYEIDIEKHLKENEERCRKFEGELIESFSRDDVVIESRYSYSFYGIDYNGFKQEKYNLLDFYRNENALR